MESHHLDKRYQEITQEVLNDGNVVDFLQKNNIDHDSPILKKGIGRIYEFYEANKLKDAAYIPRLVLEDGIIKLEYYPSTKLLEQEKNERRKKLFQLLCAPDKVKKSNLKDFEHNGRDQAYFDAIKFVNDIVLNSQKFVKGPYFHGKFGVGKTFLLGAIANELVGHDQQVLFVHVPTLVVELKNSIGKNDLAKFVDKIRSIPILFLDDMGAENLSSWIRDDIFTTIFQYRMDAMLPTAFTSNYNFAQLEKHFAEVKDDYDVVKARRLIERIRFLSKEIEISGKNRRE